MSIHIARADRRRMSLSLASHRRGGSRAIVVGALSLVLLAASLTVGPLGAQATKPTAPKTGSSPPSRPQGLSATDGRADPRGAAAGGGLGSLDFGALMDLIEQTVAPDSWSSAGGPGSMQAYPAGVYADPDGVLKDRLRAEAGSARLPELRRSARVPALRSEVARRSPLRKISLPRLERHVQARLALGLPLGDEVRYLAGLERVQYIFAYPEQHELVIAGPAEGWRFDELGRAVGKQSGWPAMQLDDWVVALRAAGADAHGTFGCKITPRQENLKSVLDFLSLPQQPFGAGGRSQTVWLRELRGRLGLQDIGVHGVPAGSHAGLVLVEADYRMKLIGIGLEAGVAGIPNYLDLVNVDDPDGPPPLEVLRWWFTMNYDGVLAGPQSDAFEIRGQGVQVLSENELLSSRGERVHTGRAEPNNRLFARKFTEHYLELARKQTVFAELRNLFDLGLAAALIVKQGLPQQVGWQMPCFAENGAYQPYIQAPPERVETVMNQRVAWRGKRRHLIVVVSGGIDGNPRRVLDTGGLQAQKTGEAPAARLRASREGDPLPVGRWWWD